MHFKSFSIIVFTLSIILINEVKCFSIPITDVEVNNTVNDAPIIGVVTQEMLNSLENLYPGMYHSYIAASYIKFVEGSGGRVIPIWIGKPRCYYENIMAKINGVVFPGGAAKFNVTDGYAEAGEHIYTIAKRMNDEGNYFPIWGACLGFELLTYLSANGKEHRARCSSNKQPLPLEFKNDFRESKMFSKANDEVIKILSNEAVTANFHSYCVTEKNLTDFNIDNEWRVMSLNHDVNGFEFISSIESKNYPFYAVQFHPEKISYEWILNRNISHTANAITANTFFGDFFINEARKNLQTFANRSEEQKYLIYNFVPTYTGDKGIVFEQCYMFQRNLLNISSC